MEFEPINLTAVISAVLGGVAGIIYAWSQMRKYARQAVEQAERESPEHLRQLVEAHESRLQAQSKRIDEQARINDLQEAKITRLQARFNRAMSALAAFSRALQALDPQHAHALQEEYADIMREE